MLRPREVFRASKLDDFRDYLSGETFTGEEYTTEMFRARLLEREETAKMAAGTAVHKVLELASVGELSEAEQDGWRITFDLDADLPLPPMREVPLSRWHAGETLFGRVDSITAMTVHDIKTTAAIDAERYLESYQWRAYLWMSGRDTFVYDLFKTKVNEDERSVTITEYAPLRVHRYDGMDGDVERVFEEYVRAVRCLNIGV